ncbi:hypothetical protein ES702_01423 [subsurface metagenome]
MSWRRRRFSVDLDKPTRLELLRVYFNACHFFPETKVEVKQTRKGYHIRIHKEHKLEQNLDVRRNLLDDPVRIKFDEMRMVKPELHGWIDTVFKFKVKNRKIISREEPCNILAEAFYTRLPCQKPSFLG